MSQLYGLLILKMDQVFVKIYIKGSVKKGKDGKLEDGPIADDVTDEKTD